jgi:hypothetical protein
MVLLSSITMTFRPAIDSFTLMGVDTALRLFQSEWITGPQA